MASTFPIAEAQIVALFMECIFYGIYLVTFGMCMRSLLLTSDHNLKDASDIKWVTVLGTTLMSVFATLDVAFGLRHNLDAFIFYSGEGGAAQEFSNIRYWVNVMKYADWVSQTIIGDSMLIYRCFAVYGHMWKVILFPLILQMALIATGTKAVVTEASIRQNALIDDSSLKPWSNATIVLSLVNNILVTSMIVYKFWSIAGGMPSATCKSFVVVKVIRIFVDSGLMYTVTLFTSFVTGLANSNAQYGVSDVVVQVIGITFNLIVIRVDQAQKFTTTQRTSSLPRFRAAGPPHSVKGCRGFNTFDLSERTNITEITVEIDRITDDNK